MGQMLMATFGPIEWVLLAIWIVVISAPIVYSLKNKTPVALGISVALLLGYIVQYSFVVMRNYDIEIQFVWADFMLIPTRIDSPTWLHTLASAGFLHSQSDVTHVLGNVLVIALVGIPLEQRLGTNRFIVVYVLGL